MVTTEMATIQTSRVLLSTKGTHRNVICHVNTAASLLFLLILTIAASSVKAQEPGIESVVPSCEVDNVLKQYVPSSEYYSIQAQALRQELYRKLRQRLQEDLLRGSSDSSGKRSLSALARTGAFPYMPKRNVAALARAGLLKTNQEDETSDDHTQVEDTSEDDSDEFKRSLSALAKTGQLPSYQRDSDLLGSEGKRGIESLARNGELPHKRELEDLLDELYDKRHVGSLAKNFNYRPSGKRFLGALVRNGDMPIEWNDKRNLGSIMRNGKRNVGSLMRGNSYGLTYGKRYPFDFDKRNLGSIMRGHTGKRNVAALLRQDSYMSNPNDENGKTYEIEEAHPTKSDEHVPGRENEEKRNLASLKAHQKFKRAAQVQDKKGPSGRLKREAYYDSNDELPVPVYQNQNSMDYEDLVRLFGAPEEKRFLGSVARSGWFRSPGGSGGSQYRSPDKRHIGSLARLGWLPSFRSARSRFSRSGRSAPCDDDTLTTFRADSADGETENYALPEDQILSGKHFLLQSPVDNLLLRKTQFSNL